MTRFSLEEWLKDKSRKVVTRRGNSVRIICTDANEETPIAVLVTVNDMGQDKLATALYTKDGRYGSGNSPYDLFFADEEKELTEFEKAIKKLIESCCNEVEEANITNAGAKEISSHLLDLAKKELQPEIDKEIDKAYKNIDTIVYDNGYKQGQYEIMEDLPKWKKAEKDEELDCHVAIQQDDRVVLSDFVQKDEYYITLNVLKKLPKEE